MSPIIVAVTTSTTNTTFIGFRSSSLGAGNILLKWYGGA